MKEKDPRRVAAGKKAAKTIKARYGMDENGNEVNPHEIIGRAGGKVSRGGGFAWMRIHDPERFEQISRKGGKISKRPKGDSDEG
jgi:general stress protein YciG